MAAHGRLSDHQHIGNLLVTHSPSSEPQHLEVHQNDIWPKALRRTDCLFAILCLAGHRDAGFAVPAVPATPSGHLLATTAPDAQPNAGREASVEAFDSCGYTPET